MYKNSWFCILIVDWYTKVDLDLLKRNCYCVKTIGIVEQLHEIAINIVSLSTNHFKRYYILMILKVSGKWFVSFQVSLWVGLWFNSWRTLESRLLLSSSIYDTVWSSMICFVSLYFFPQETTFPFAFHPFDHSLPTTIVYHDPRFIHYRTILKIALFP